MAKATIKEVAAEAEVSTATVSRVLNDSGYVSDEIRERVLEAVAKLNYQPSAIARSLKQDKTYMIGVIVPDISNPYFMGISRGIEDAVGAEGFQLMFCSSDENPEKEGRLLQLLREKRGDAVVLATAGSGLLPRAGCWMETVRRLVGFAFIGMAIWIVTPLMPAGLELVLYVLLAVALGIDLVRRIRPKPATAVTLALVLAGLAVASVLDGKETGQAQARIVLRSTVATSPLEFREARSAADLIEQMKAAAGAPILVYVTADWCVICRSIERSVLTDTDVVAALQGMHLVKLDVTDFNPAPKSVLAQLRAAGPPTMVFLDGSLREASGTRLVGSVSAEAVIRSVKGMAE